MMEYRENLLFIYHVIMLLQLEHLTAFLLFNSDGPVVVAAQRSVQGGSGTSVTLNCKVQSVL